MEIAETMTSGGVSVSNLTIRQIQIFLVTSRSDNFTDAAKKLGIAQSTLSVAISRIENVLGVTVFDRSTRRVTLTPEGGRLAAAADVIVYTYETAVRNLRNSDDAARKVRFAFVEAMSGAIAPAAISKFRQLQENYDVSAHDVGSETAIKMLRDGSVDFAIISGGPRLAGIAQEIIGQTELDVIASPTRELPDSQSAKWADLAGLPLILAGSLRRRGYLQAMWVNAGQNLWTAYELNDMATAIGFAAEGLGYLIIPHTYLPRPLDPRLVAIRLNEVDMRWPLQLIYPEGRVLAAPQRLLVECLRQELSAIK